MNYEEKIPKIPEQCIRCDQSCASSCHSLGPQGCHVCRTGYFRDNDKGCIDIDECNVSDVELNPCKFQTYCMNTQGSYKCYRKCLLHYYHGYCEPNQIAWQSFINRFLDSKI